MIKKKYNLKPGLHQFAPGSPAFHHNNNLTDAEAEWYLERYPHIKSLFEIDINDLSSVPSLKRSVKSKSKKSVKSKKNNENLSTTN